MTLIEIVASLFGLTSVWLTVKRNIWLWPSGMVMSGFYIFIFFEARLYSETILQAIFVVLQVYGWHRWLHGGRGDFPVSRLSLRQVGAWLGGVVLGAAVLGRVMDAGFGAALPYPDAFVTMMSLSAQWLVGRKVLECWLGWISSDVVAIGIYMTKGLYPTAGLYSTFLVMSTIGWITWRKTLRPACPPERL